jgi:hypothetical protein
MRFEGYMLGRFLLAAGFVSATGAAAQAAVVFATDFNNVAPGTYAEGTTLNAGGVTTDNVVLRSVTGSATTIVDRGGGNNALQFTDNSADSALAGNPRAYSSPFGPLSTGATGENRLFGSVDYTRLLSTTAGATSPSFVFIASSAGAQTPNGTNASIQFNVEANGRVYYNNGITGTDTNVTLTPGVEYRFTVDADFSSTTQDTWSLTVTRLSDSVAVFTRTGINTRAPNVAVNLISMLGGLNIGAVNASPSAQIDNINFESGTVPEPAAATVILAAGAALLRRRSR